MKSHIVITKTKLEGTFKLELLSPLHLHLRMTCTLTPFSLSPFEMVLLLLFALPLASPDLNSLPDFSVDLGDGDGGQFFLSISNSSEQQPGQYQILR
jgi:hypothetical protein